MTSPPTPFAPLEAVLFDCDGLLADTEPLHQAAFNALLAPHGLGLSDHDYRQFVGKGDFVCAHQILARWPELAAQWQADAVVAEKRARFAALVAAPGRVPPMPGARTLVAEVRAAGLGAAVVSSTVRRELLPLLRNIGLLDAFDLVVAGDDAAAPKPAPDLYLHALAALRLRPGATLALEDSAIGIAAARAAGLVVVAVPNAYSQHQDLSAAQFALPSLVGVGPAELRALLLRHRSGA